MKVGCGAVSASSEMEGLLARSTHCPNRHKANVDLNEDAGA